MSLSYLRQKYSPFIMALCSLSMGAHQVQAQPCPPLGGFISPAKAASQGEIRLPDGSLIKLSGINIPRLSAAPAHAFIEQNLAQFPIRYVPLTQKPDRYGRILAQIILHAAQNEIWLQHSLIEQGLALASLLPHEMECAPDLLAAETTAQTQKRGLWSTHPVIAATDRTALARAQGQFALIEGQVLSVNQRARVTYLNFGRDWKHDFTAVILKRDAANFATLPMELSQLVGKTVRVRGILDAKTPPRLVLEHGLHVQILGSDLIK